MFFQSYVSGINAVYFLYLPILGFQQSFILLVVGTEMHFSDPLQGWMTYYTRSWEGCPRTAISCQPHSDTTQCHTPSQGGHTQWLMDSEPLTVSITGMLECPALSPQLRIILMDHSHLQNNLYQPRYPIKTVLQLNFSLCSVLPFPLTNDDPKSIT